MRHRYSPHINWQQTLDDVLEVGGADPVEGIARLVAALRPHRTRPEDADSRLQALADRLEAGAPEIRQRLGQLVRRTLSGLRSTETLVEAGVPNDRGFFDEAAARVGRRMLPEVVEADTLRGAIRLVFDRGDDHRWLAAIDPAGWQRMLGLIEITAESVEGIAEPLATAMRALTHHIASLGLHPSITRLTPEVDDPDSPFLALSDIALTYIRSFENAIVGDEDSALLDTLRTLDDCRQHVIRLRAEKHRFGTSLRLTGLTVRLEARIERLDLLLHLSEPIERDFTDSARRLLIALVEAEDTVDHIRPHLRTRTDLLAFQVVEHAARKGSRYITETAGEYARFLGSSLIGGAIVAIFALAKVLLVTTVLKDAAPFADAIVQGLNYAICFVLIALAGGTLATKQPAMTANTLARTMEPRDGEHDVDGLADLVVRVTRSQFISFVGNLGAALPLGIALSWLWTQSFGSPLAGPEKAEALLAELHPWQSGSLIFAAVAGVWLATAGLLSGWLDNRALYARLPERIAGHPLLSRVLGAERATRLGAWSGAKLGKLGGNIFLGFALGGTATVGLVLGLPLDIRHIAFASAHFGLALEVLGPVVIPAYALQVGLGVMLIGLVNFLVSFGMTLTLALRARRFSFDEGGALVWAVVLRFVRRPWRFFVPPRSANASTAAPPATES